MLNAGVKKKTFTISNFRNACTKLKFTEQLFYQNVKLALKNMHWSQNGCKYWQPRNSNIVQGYFVHWKLLFCKEKAFILQYMNDEFFNADYTGPTLY